MASSCVGARLVALGTQKTRPLVAPGVRSQFWTMTISILETI